jgi:hypothetical protein
MYDSGSEDSTNARKVPENEPNYTTLVSLGMLCFAKLVSAEGERTVSGLKTAYLFLHTT